MEQLLGEHQRQLETEQAELSRHQELFAQECDEVRADLAEQQRSQQAHWEQRRRALREEADESLSVLCATLYCSVTSSLCLAEERKLLLGWLLCCCDVMIDDVMMLILKS